MIDAVTALIRHEINKKYSNLLYIIEINFKIHKESNVKLIVNI